MNMDMKQVIADNIQSLDKLDKFSRETYELVQQGLIDSASYTESSVRKLCEQLAVSHGNQLNLIMQGIVNGMLYLKHEVTIDTNDYIFLYVSSNGYHAQVVSKQDLDLYDTINR